MDRTATKRPRRRRSQSVEQPSLFHPPSHRPRWQQLPPQVQRDVVELLGRLLRQTMIRAETGETSAETGETGVGAGETSVEAGETSDGPSDEGEGAHD